MKQSKMKTYLNRKVKKLQYFDFTIHSIYCYHAWYLYCFYTKNNTVLIFIFSALELNTSFVMQQNNIKKGSFFSV